MNIPTRINATADIIYAPLNSCTIFETCWQRRRIGRILQGAAAHGKRLVGNGERPAVASQRGLDGALPERQRPPLRRQRRQFRQGRRAIDVPRRQKSGLLSDERLCYLVGFYRLVRLKCFFCRWRDTC